MGAWWAPGTILVSTSFAITLRGALRREDLEVSPGSTIPHGPGTWALVVSQVRCPCSRSAA